MSGRLATLRGVKQLPSGLILLGSPTDEPFRFRCRVCGSRFRDGGRVFERHVSRCAEEHAEELHHRNTANDEFWRSGDVELETWVHENREAIVEGRKRFGGG